MPNLATSTKINGYTVDGTLFSSTRTIVRKAVRDSDNKEVILKILNSEYPSPQELSQFRYEYELLKECACEGVIEGFELGSVGNSSFIAMEDIGGTDLASFMKDRNLTTESFIEIATLISTTLGEIHAKNIIHKDINPSNILFNPATNTLKIIDFGISSFLPRENLSPKNPDQLEGSLAYISPEQTGRINRAVDYRSDFYSLGVTLYELLTGAVPFSTSDNLELIHCHIAKTPLSPSQLNPEIPEILSEIVMKLMEKEIDARYQSTFGLLHDLTVCRDYLTANKHLDISFELAQKDISARIQIPQKLYGRQKEIQTLENSLTRVADGAVGIVTISGFSGIGKTALVNEVYKTIAQKNGYFIRGKFDQFQHNVPYSAVITAFRELVAQILTESEASLSLWRANLSEALGANGAVISEVLPEIELIIGKQEPVPMLGASESQKRFTLIFQNFMRVFCRPEHPVVIFLDDLQWVDSASLNLIEFVTADPDQNSLFLVLAYRDNEVDPTHHFMITLEKIRKKGISIDEIAVTPLEPSDISELLAETLHRTTNEVAPLTDLVVEKTNGNPFFVQQFIFTLAQENLLTLAHPTATEKGFWQWDIEKIKAQNISDNVVELMVAKLKKLPAEAQQVIALASTIGNHFDLSTLAVISEKEEEKTFAALLPLLKQGLIIPVTGTKSNTLYPQLFANSFCFLHDRVQQAAYELVAETDRAPLHLKIGRLLLQNRDADEIASSIFDITSHFNKALALITESETVEVICLNLRSGIKSRGFSSYDSSFEYLKTALKLLPKDAWEKSYDFAFEVSMEYCQSGFLAAQFQEGEKVLADSIGLVKTPIERAQIYHMQAKQYLAMEKIFEVLPLQLKALNELGLEIPEEPTLELFIQELTTVNTLRQGKSIEDIVSAPQIKDPTLLLTAQILSEMVLPAFILQKELLFAICAFKQVTISLQYGNNPEVPFAYVILGMVLSGMGDFKSANEVGQIGMALNDRYPNTPSSCRAIFCYAGYILPRNNRWTELEEWFLKAIEAGKQNGDLFFLSFAAINAAFHIQDTPLEKQLEKLQYYHKITVQVGYPDAIYGIEMAIQSFKALIGKTNNAYTYNDDKYDEDEVLAALNAVNKVEILCPFYLNKSRIQFLHGRTLDARKSMTEVDMRRKVIDGNPESVIHALYSFLIEATCLPDLPPEEQEKARIRMNEELTRVTAWANHCPANFEHLKDFMTAELARMAGDLATAQKLYPKAIAGAKAAQWLQHEAIYNERFAEYWFEQGNETIGNLYIHEAHYRYQVWGATVKVGLLEEKYDVLRNQQNFLMPHTTHPHTTSFTKSGTSTLSRTEGIDLQSFLKASTTLSGEIILSTLLEKMIHIVIENAGAQRGVLLLPKNGKWFIEAEGFSNSREATVLQSVSIAGSEFIPESIVHFVARTGDSLVLQNASIEGTFTKDSYVATKKPKSILCTPLFNQGNLTGILYLENSLTAGAFTSQRVAISNLLSSQIAISIENSLLYNNLEEKVEERTRELEEQTEELKREKERANAANEAKSTFLANMSHEIRTPMNAILGFTEILKERITEPQNSKFLDTIQTSGNVLLNLINDILDLSKIESGKMELNQSPASLKNLAQEMHTIFYQKVDTKGLAFNIDVDGSIPRALIMDETRVRQIMINLIGNAIKFTRQGAVSLHIHCAEVIGVHSRVNIQIDVEDTGIGIADDQQEKIFNAFEQVTGQDSSQYGGTGLGLSICRRLTDMMKGEITCTSVLGKGTTFTVTIPNVEVSATESLSKQEHTLDYSRICFEPATILITDDVDYNREMIATYLAEWNLTPLFACNGKEAIAIASDKKPDLILIDMKMPIMDGFEASGRIKADDVIKNIPLIAVTASAFKEDENRISQFCDGYLRKPVSKSRLVREIMKYLPHTIGDSAETVADPMTTMSVPSRETLLKIKEMAKNGYMQQIESFVSQLKESDSQFSVFADTVHHLVANFDDDGIVALVEKHLK